MLIESRRMNEQFAAFMSTVSSRPNSRFPCRLDRHAAGPRLGAARSGLPTGPAAGVIAGLLLLGSSVSGCSSNPPTFGEKLMSQGDEIAEIGEAWEAGKSRMRKGRKLIERGRDQVEDGQQDIAEGERLVRTGEQMVKDSERQYRQLSGGRELPGS